MRAIIIDNHSKYTDDLLRLFGEYETVVVEYQQIDSREIRSDDLVVLSGGHGHPVLWHPDEYAQETALVREHEGPVIGICLGFQLVAHMFGAHFHMLEQRSKGLREIQTTEAGLLDAATYHVYANHRWATPKVPKPLLELARSDDGVEIVKHMSRPLYAVQFHPEYAGDKAHQGTEIIKRILQDIAPV